MTQFRIVPTDYHDTDRETSSESWMSAAIDQAQAPALGDLLVSWGRRAQGVC